MKTYIKRCTLALIMCALHFSCHGQEQYIINEDFSEFIIPQGIVWTQGSKTINNWELLYCSIHNNYQTNNSSLKIEGYSSGNNFTKGYAITPEVHLDQEELIDAYLSFKCAKTDKSKKNVTVKVSILSHGQFEDNNSSERIVNVDEHTSAAEISTNNFLITNIQNSSKVKFEVTESNKYVTIDEVIITRLPSFTVDENVDNTSTLTANADKTVTVNLARTLTGGIWNTLCLPFDVTMEDMKLALGEGLDIKMRTFSSYADKVMTFAEATAVSAGTPFLIKLNTTVENPTFHAVTVKNTTAQTVTSNGVSFVGTYSPVPLNINGTNLFITKNNTLALPAEGMNIMNGLRAYIVVPENFDSSGARLMMDDGETTAVSELAPSTEGVKPEATYNLKGQHVKNGRRGLYVINGKLTLVK